MKLLMIKQKDNGLYEVTDYFSEYRPVLYKTYGDALNLCRLRTHKTLANDVTIFKVPFINLWLVW